MDFILNSVLSLFSAISGWSLWIEVLFWIGVAVFLGWITGAIRYIRHSRVGVVEKSGACAARWKPA